MRREPVFCVECEHHSKPSKDAPTWRWMCLKTPRVGPSGYVTRDKWDTDPPYYYCVNVNRVGECELYEPARSIDHAPIAETD